MSKPHAPSRHPMGGRPNSSKQSTFDCFASCPRGMEAMLQTELEQLGASECKIVHGGLHFKASWRQATRMTYWSRFAGRIGLQVAKAACNSDEDLYKMAKAVDWENWFKLSHTFRVDLNNRGAQVKSLRFTQLRLKDAVCDHFSEVFDERPNISVENPDIRIFGAISSDMAVLYIDLAGENLFKRGWRQDKGIAPLKENLAAGLWHVMSNSQAYQTHEHTFLDPFCGSGTLVIESLSAMCNRAPGLERNFAFEKLKPFDPAWIEELQDNANQRFNAGLDSVLKERPFQWHASDITEVLVEMASNNAAQAGFAELMEAGLVKFSQRDALTVAPPTTSGLILSNPPYGERVRAKGADVPEDEAYERLFKAYGNHLKQAFSGWTCFLLSGDLDIKQTLGLSPKRKTPFFNGTIDCRLFEIPLTHGSYRPRSTQTLFKTY